jgi:hypothetical protein
MTVSIQRECGTSGQRTYVLDGPLDLIQLPATVGDAKRCRCGQYFAWRGGPENRPSCPRCSPTGSDPPAGQAQYAVENLDQRA